MSSSYQIVNSSPRSDLSFDHEKPVDFHQRRSRRLWTIAVIVVLLLVLVATPSYTDTTTISDNIRTHIQQPLCSSLDSATQALGGTTTFTQNPPSRNAQLIQRKLVAKLRAGQAVTIGIVGGSISVGGSALPNNYAHLLDAWLNKVYPVTDGSGKEHKIINKAVGGEISGVAAICLETELPRSLPLDLLLLEFAYNDSGEYAAGSTAENGMAIGPAANYERMIRQALKWETAVMAVEFVGYQTPGALGDASGYFSSSAGHLHAEPLVLYGIPIVDYAGFIYTIPHKDVVKSFYGTATDGIHPQLVGHTMTASLIIREILYHVNLAGRLQVPWFKDSSEAYVGPSFPLLEDYPYHGIHYKLHPSLTDPEAPLAPIGEPHFISHEADGWACYCTRIPDSLARLNQSLVAQEGFTYGVDERDGGRFRSKTRPGFLAEQEGSHMVFELPQDTTDIALLVRKSWQVSGQASTWISTSKDSSDAAEQDGVDRCCPSGPSTVDGHWDSQSTQMTFDPICAEFSRDADCKYLHVRTTQAGYFKLYGYATVEKPSEGGDYDNYEEKEDVQG